MAKEKNEIFTPISVEEATKYLAEKRNEILEAFSKAYLAETGLMPSEIELVAEQNPMTFDKIETIYYFRKKTDA